MQPQGLPAPGAGWTIRSPPHPGAAFGTARRTPLPDAHAQLRAGARTGERSYKVRGARTGEEGAQGEREDVRTQERRKGGVQGRRSRYGGKDVRRKSYALEGARTGGGARTGPTAKDTGSRGTHERVGACRLRTRTQEHAAGKRGLRLLRVGAVPHSALPYDGGSGARGSRPAPAHPGPDQTGRRSTSPDPGGYSPADTEPPAPHHSSPRCGVEAGGVPALLPGTRRALLLPALGGVHGQWPHPRLHPGTPGRCAALEDTDGTHTGVPCTIPGPALYPGQLRAHGHAEHNAWLGLSGLCPQRDCSLLPRLQ